MIGSSVQFAVVRVVLCAFLAGHFLSLLPYAAEIYSSEGMYPSEVRSPFPSLLGILDSKLQVEAFFVVSVLASCLFAAGIHRRICAVLLWYGWACLTNRVPFLYIPSEGLVGWLLLLSAAIPSGERWSVRPRPKPEWALPPAYLFAVWIVLGAGYLASGIDKLASPSWQQGTAVRSVLMSPIARWELLAEAAAEAPLWFVQAMSWSVVAAEVSFIGFIWHRWTRPIGWLALGLMHVGIRFTLYLHTISDPFLIAHLLIFDPRWISRIASPARL